MALSCGPLISTAANGTILGDIQCQKKVDRFTHQRSAAGASLFRHTVNIPYLVWVEGQSYY
jgi:hypothetical protein